MRTMSNASRASVLTKPGHCRTHPKTKNTGSLMELRIACQYDGENHDIAVNAVTALEILRTIPLFATSQAVVIGVVHRV